METPPASRVSVGGDCIIIGLFTRFFAAAFAIEMLIDLLFVQLPKGYAAGDGYEYRLVIGAAPTRSTARSQKNSKQACARPRQVATLRTHTLLSCTAAPP
jgi:hypothetical protein